MRKIFLFFKSILIGVALVLPGLSGSLMAVLLGMYEIIVDWMSAVKKNMVKLLVLVMGAGVGILISAKLVLSVCVRYPVQSNLFFIGLVAGGIPLLIGRIRKKPFTGSCIPVMLIGFASIFAMSLVSPVNAEFQAAITHVHSLREGGILLLSGFISCGLMMLPGVSGSVLLILLGQYGTVYGAVSDLSSIANWLRVLPICILFGIGGLLGIWVVSKVMKKALTHFASSVQWLILGLTSGTCGALAWVSLGQGGAFVHVLWLVLGFLLTMFTTKLEQQK